MAAPQTTLMVPVESQVRELDAKLLLACVAAERGFPVVIGSRAFVHTEIEVSEIRSRFGQFLMMNTNFSFVNAFASSLNLMQESKTPAGALMAGKNTLGMTPEFARGLAAHKGALFENFRELVPVLAEAFPNYTIVVRPHPSEDHAAWREAAHGCDNVRVVKESSVIPWLMAATALVHNGCTTALEAAALGTPAVAYRPVTQKAFDLELPNALSHEACDLEELLGKLRAIAAGRLDARNDRPRHALPERHIGSLEGPLAADRMVDVLSAEGYAGRLSGRPAPAAHLKGWLHARGRAAVKRINRRSNGHRSAAEYHTHRFPGTSLEDLNARIQRFAAGLGRFEHLRVTQLSDHIFRVDG